MNDEQLAAAALEKEQEAKRIRDILSDEPTFNSLLTLFPDINTVTRIYIELQDGNLKVVLNDKTSVFKTIDYTMPDTTVVPIVGLLTQALVDKATTLFADKKAEIIASLS